MLLFRNVGRAKIAQLRKSRDRARLAHAALTFSIFKVHYSFREIDVKMSRTRSFLDFLSKSTTFWFSINYLFTFMVSTFLAIDFCTRFEILEIIRPFSKGRWTYGFELESFILKIQSKIYPSTFPLRYSRGDFFIWKITNRRYAIFAHSLILPCTLFTFD